MKNKMLKFHFMLLTITVECRNMSKINYTCLLQAACRNNAFSYTSDFAPNLITNKYF